MRQSYENPRFCFCFCFVFSEVCISLWNRKTIDTRLENLISLLDEKIVLENFDIITDLSVWRYTNFVYSLHEGNPYLRTNVCNNFEFNLLMYNKIKWRWCMVYTTPRGAQLQSVPFFLQLVGNQTDSIKLLSFPFIFSCPVLKAIAEIRKLSLAQKTFSVRVSMQRWETRWTFDTR